MNIQLVTCLLSITNTKDSLQNGYFFFLNQALMRVRMSCFQKQALEGNFTNQLW